MTFERYKKWLHFDERGWSAFFLYALSYTILGLTIPLGVQLLVSNLAFSGMTANILVIGLVMAVGLGFMQLFRYAQIHLVEYLERQILQRTSPAFARLSAYDRPLFFELTLIPKVLSKWAVDGFDIGLTLLVGPLVLMVYHPVYILMALSFWGCLALVYQAGKRGLETSIEESRLKYEVWHQLDREEPYSTDEWLRAREGHFSILRLQMLILMLAQVLGPVALLVGGAFLFSSSDISLGQFVAVELIGSGLFMSLGKLATFMETHYSLLTSLTKLDHVLESHHD